ncbi:LacI family DNA-binding transcriptional regulator [Ereboglobus luteus]|uniref:HTH lacI-type domain-containing protein n=1 Tax=Ereboglobus luteus TaxID=1796921 RepID=A0A2U8E4F8_9BACT|nr:LacI family DNA-binding transcriptional regulator [Ereboglobus luteus]AWI09706.1 hypothetical protein CKA38_10985 [Ereboglobus luteus]
MSKTIHTTAELAKHLGISRWAVSRAINGQPGVSEETVARVRRAMSELHFSPSPHARGLRGQRTGVIGLSIRNLNTQVAVEKITHAHHCISNRGLHSLMAISEDDPVRGTDMIKRFISMRADGVILVDAPPPEVRETWLQMLRNAEIPAVMLEPRRPGDSNTVSLDRTEALAKVTDHLLDLGHRHFALLGISKKFPMGVPRHEGVRKALKARGLDMKTCVDVFDMPEHRHLGMRYGHELAELYLASKRRATALIALDDMVATGAMWELQRNGVKVPRDCSLFGFDNLPFTEQMTPALSTVDHNVEKMAEAAVDMLQRLIVNNWESDEADAINLSLPSIRLSATLVLRDTTIAPSQVTAPVHETQSDGLDMRNITLPTLA